MDIDKETLLRLVGDVSSTKANVQRILDSLERGDEEFKKLYHVNELMDLKFQKKCEALEAQIAKIKTVQDVLTGKFSVIWAGIGAAIASIAQLIFYLWNRRGG